MTITMADGWWDTLWWNNFLDHAIQQYENDGELIWFDLTNDECQIVVNSYLTEYDGETSIKLVDGSIKCQLAFETIEDRFNFIIVWS